MKIQRLNDPSGRSTLPDPDQVRGEMRIRPGIEWAGATDVGCQRQNNEDRYSYWEPIDESDFEQRGRLAIVADGMGGYEGGQEASRIAVEAIEDVYASEAVGEPHAFLIAGFHMAHRRIREFADEHPELHGMGTTCTAAVVLGSHLYFAHVGDSRLYMVRGAAIMRLTRDDSYVSRLVEQGVINAAEAETHPQRHILTAALGAGAEAEPDCPLNPLELNPGDVLVLCSDGLWGMVRDQEIADTVRKQSPKEACQSLIDLARKRGGPDNITLQVLKVDD